MLIQQQGDNPEPGPNIPLFCSLQTEGTDLDAKWESNLPALPLLRQEIQVSANLSECKMEVIGNPVHRVIIKKRSDNLLLDRRSFGEGLESSRDVGVGVGDVHPNIAVLLTEIRIIGGIANRIEVAKHVVIDLSHDLVKIEDGFEPTEMPSIGPQRQAGKGQLLGFSIGACRGGSARLGKGRRGADIKLAC